MIANHFDEDRVFLKTSFATDPKYSADYLKFGSRRWKRRKLMEHIDSQIEIFQQMADIFDDVSNVFLLLAKKHAEVNTLK